ncbi:MAG: hypothetical protein L6R40_008751, partial [Gallowayella cf. fulva]
MRSSKIIPLLIAAAFATFLFSLGTVLNMRESAPTGPVYTAPTSPMTYPACASEDGAGMVLCTWQADSMGNGEGTSITSGDCATYVGYTQELCINTHAMGQGGADTVQNCNDILNSNSYENNWTIDECFKN